MADRVTHADLLFLLVDLDPDTRRYRHAQRHHDHETFGIIALDVADRRRDDDLTGIAIKTLVMRDADRLFVGRTDRSQFTDFHPGAFIGLVLSLREAAHCHRTAQSGKRHEAQH